MPSTDRNLRCVVVTPERAVLDQDVDFVALPMYDGELGVLPGRSPMIGRLGCGELRIRRGEETERFFVDGGFAQIRKNVVTVLTARAVKGEEINIESLTQTLQSARPAFADARARELWQSKRDQAQAQLRVARRVSGHS